MTDRARASTQYVADLTAQRLKSAEADVLRAERSIERAEQFLDRVDTNNADRVKVAKDLRVMRDFVLPRRKRIAEAAQVAHDDAIAELDRLNQQ